MAGAVTVRGGGWRVKDVRGREVGPPALPTMADTGEIDLRRFFRTLWRGKWILLATMVAAMGATTYWLLHVTPLYTADALIVIESHPSSIVKVDEAVQDVSSDDAKVNTEVAILESRGLAARVIRQLELEDDPEFLEEDFEAPAEPSSDGHEADIGAAGAEMGAATPHGSAGASASDFLAKLNPDAVLSSVSAALESARSFLTSAWAGDPSGTVQGSVEPANENQETALLADEAGERKAVALLDQFLKGLSVEFEDKSRLISISFTSTDPKKAALIANKIVDEYIESQLEAKSEGARRAAEWLEVRLAELGETVKSLEQSVQQRRAESGTDGMNIVSQRLAELTSQLVSAQAASAAAGARYKQVRTVLDGHGNLNALPAVIESAMVQGLRAKHSELTARLSDLQTIYGERHPQIVSTRAEMAGIERRLRGETSNILAGLHNELESAEMNEAALRQELATVRQEMFQLDQAEAHDPTGGSTFASEPGSLPEPSQAIYRGGGIAGEPAAGRPHDLAGGSAASPVPPELPSDDGPFIRGLGKLSGLPAGHRRASPPKTRYSGGRRASRRAAGHRRSTRPATTAALSVKPSRLYRARAAL